MKANLTLLEYPHSTEEILDNRIEGLFDYMSKTDKDCIPDVLTALIWYIVNSYEYEGEDYLYQVEVRLTEALCWWKKAMDE
tara:strand:+ start:127 stop:369 length:243 start_codon:yes stop_codon:yes gene_type:complete